MILNKKKISVVSVAYKDEGNIKELYKRLTKILERVVQIMKLYM